MSLREWADPECVEPQTADRWFREGSLPFSAQKMSKLTLVGDLDAA
jgi:predicted site-specific integrase-resolvase